MKSAVRDDNPVLYIESKYLYRRLKGEVPEDDGIVEIGKAEVKRQGSDLTVITYGSALHLCLEAATILSTEDGGEAKVVDLRTLTPLDKESILESVRETGKAVIVHEDNLTGGIGAEIAALIVEHEFRSLDAPVMRVGAIDTPVPFAPSLEEAALPDTRRVLDALRTLNKY
jgi:2-oxoisovalerate dehydrogenase E1 component beta subunit